MGYWLTVRIARRALLKNKLRAGLTVLGIVIGIAAVIAMVSIGQSARDRKSTRLNSSHIQKSRMPSSA